MEAPICRTCDGPAIYRLALDWGGATAGFCCRRHIVEAVRDGFAVRSLDTEPKAPMVTRRPSTRSAKLGGSK
jgi:hypothetical protein